MGWCGLPGCGRACRCCARQRQPPPRRAARRSGSPFWQGRADQHAKTPRWRFISFPPSCRRFIEAGAPGRRWPCWCWHLLQHRRSTRRRAGAYRCDGRHFNHARRRQAHGRMAAARAGLHSSSGREAGAEFALRSEPHVCRGRCSGRRSPARRARRKWQFSVASASPASSWLSSNDTSANTSARRCQARPLWTAYLDAVPNRAVAANAPDRPRRLRILTRRGEGGANARAG